MGTIITIGFIFGTVWILWRAMNGYVDQHVRPANAIVALARKQGLDV